MPQIPESYFPQRNEIIISVSAQHRTTEQCSLTLTDKIIDDAITELHSIFAHNTARNSDVQLTPQPSLCPMEYNSNDILYNNENISHFVH